MPLRSVVRAVAQSRTLQLASLGQGAQLLVAATVLAWMPTYLARYHALPPDVAALAAAGLLLASGAGSVAIGAFTDRSARRRPGSRLAVAVAVALVTASCLAIGLHPSRCARRSRRSSRSSRASSVSPPGRTWRARCPTGSVSLPR
jgi:MFS family permease